MAYYLGLDAGATKTACALSADDRILARATSGTIKIMRASEEEATANLDRLLHQVSAEAGVPLRSIASSCVGLAGFSVRRIAEWVGRELSARVSGEVFLCGDEEIALDAAFFGKAGVLVMAGTGSNTAARTSDGRWIHVGGWGPVVADEGSGNWIGKNAVRAVFDASDRAEKTLLFSAILEAWSIQTLGELIDRANQIPGPNFSKLPPVVVACADRGDKFAQGVLRRAGEDLGTYALLALQRLQAAEPHPASPPGIAFTGSVLHNIAAVRDAMRATIRAQAPDVEIQPEAVDPVVGALWLARHPPSQKDDKGHLIPC